MTLKWPGLIEYQTVYMKIPPGKDAISDGKKNKESGSPKKKADSLSSICFP